jgi:hypothetical protein
MSVLLARSYTSAASSTFLWPSVPLTTTAFTPARRIMRVRVWRKSCQPPILTPTAAAAGCKNRRRTLPELIGVHERDWNTHFRPSPNARMRRMRSACTTESSGSDCSFSSTSTSPS